MEVSVRKLFAGFALCAVIFTAMTSCANGNMRETTITAAHGPADTALPYQAVFAVDESVDERLISAAKKFCDRTVEFSNGSTVFSFVLSKNPLKDLREGKADAILLENAAVPAFSPMSEAFRYKSYEHFSMAANSAATLSRLSDILGANVFAGFYAGSNVFLSCGTLDSKFKPQRRDAAEVRDAESVSVTTISDTTTYAFSLLGANVTKENALDLRTAYFSQTNSFIELSPLELDSPALLNAILAKSLENFTAPSSGDDASGDENSESVQIEPEPLAITRAFTDIKPVWLVFAPTSYEKISQTGRMAVAESAAYMSADIDGVYLQYEQEKIDLLVAEDVIVSRNFASTRAQALRLADEHASFLTANEQRLREIISKVQ